MNTEKRHFISTKLCYRKDFPVTFLTSLSDRGPKSNYRDHIASLVNATNKKTCVRTWKLHLPFVSDIVIAAGLRSTDIIW